MLLKWFELIYFIDDLSRYSYSFLIAVKSGPLDVFKIHKTEVENQLEKKLKL